MKDYKFSTIKALKEKIESKQVTAQEVLQASLDQFKLYDVKVDSALEVYDKESILKKYQENTEKFGLLQAIPGIIKANICQKDRVTSCASKMLENYKAPYDATVINRLKNAGALLVGSANMDDAAMGSSTETSAFKKTKNPWDLTRVPGGSSGGSAAAVAAGFVPWALGTDTGGSIRQPAALCGIVGLKPTYGLVSRFGLIAYGSSLDCVGPLTRTVYDNALVLSVLAGADTSDSSSLNTQPQDYTQHLTGSLKKDFTLGVIENALVPEAFDSEVYQALMDAIERYKQLGARIKYIKLPSFDYGAATYFIISRAEAASNLARFDGVKFCYRDKDGQTLSEMYQKTREYGFGEEVKRRILIGNYVLSAGHSDEYYALAQRVRALIRHELMQAFKDVDLLFAPCSPYPAFKFNAYADNKLNMDLQDYSTAPANLAGIPAIAVPCGFTKDKLPIGFQLFGPDLSEHDLFQAAYAYEQSNEWYKFTPDYTQD